MTTLRYFVGTSRPHNFFGTPTSGGYPGSLWEVGTTSARRIDLPKMQHKTIEAEDGEDVLTKLRASIQHDLHELRLPPASFFPRIARPSRFTRSLISPCYRDWQDVIATSKGQFLALMRSLEDICRVVHPEALNFGVYGHETRNLLLLASMEVEAQWKGILRANGIEGRNTADYIKLSEPLNLMQYAVTYPSYPWLSEIKPFRDWTDGPNPTQRLPWYSAYNATKHDRENSFREASLENVLNAVAACFVMLIAQFGEHEEVWGKSGFPDILSITQRPTWSVSEMYYVIDANSAFEATTPYPFT